MTEDLDKSEKSYPNGGCCVFQPFDKGGAFDKRFDEIISPALEAAGLEPYRVDRDPSSIIPMDTLHLAIQSARICLADFSTRNPNVMYEMGYAFAAGKQVILITDRNGEKFPFDIQHRTIIEYSRESPQDFSNLQNQITAKANALLTHEKAMQLVAASEPTGPAGPTDSLADHEAKALALIYSWSNATDDDVAASTIRELMADAFVNQLGCRLALSALIAKNLAVRESRRSEDYDRGPYYVYRITEAGEQWMLENQQRFDIGGKASRKPAVASRVDDGILADDVRF